MLKYVYIPAGRQQWFELAKELEANHRITPTIWLGDDQHLEAARQRFPDCEVISFVEANLARSRPTTANTGIIPEAVYQSASFERLRNLSFELMQRQDLHGEFVHKERECVFELTASRLWSLLEERSPDFVLASEMAHSAATLILTAMCEMRGIPILHFQAVSFAPMLLPRSGFGYTPIRKREMRTGVDAAEATEVVRSFVDQRAVCSADLIEPPYMKIQRLKENSFTGKRGFLRSLWRATKRATAIPSSGWPIDYQYRSNWDCGPPTRLREFIVSLRGEIRANRSRRALRKSYHSLAIHDLPSSGYVYFALHYEPERTTLPDGGFHHGQLRALILLRNRVDRSIPILVKEHPSQFYAAMAGHVGRTRGFYDAALSLPNVFLVPMEVAVTTLIRGALGVVTITGSAALEAAMLGVPAVSLGHPWYAGAPGVGSWPEDPGVELFDVPLESVDILSDLSGFLVGLLADSACWGLINPSNEKLYPGFVDYSATETWSTDFAYDVCQLIDELISNSPINDGIARLKAPFSRLNY